MDPNNLFGRYKKLITALSVGLLAWGGAVVASASGPITASEWITFGGVLATALGVGVVSNDPEPLSLRG
jgi:hypothetical protein